MPRTTKRRWTPAELALLGCEPDEEPPMTSAELFETIRPRVRVTIVNRFGQESTGRAVMLGPAGWVLNMGRRYGTPAIVDERNLVAVGSRRASDR